jgi:hypothetical protein
MDMYKKVLLILGIIILSSFRTFGQVSFGKPEKINDGWKFYLGDPENAQAVAFDASKWRTLDLPHDWSVEGTLSPSLASCTGYLPGGIGWYRKTIHIPSEKQQEKIYLYFEGVYNRSEVFVNGQSVGKRPNGYISFMYDVTPFVRFGEPNTIAVRVDHSLSADSRWYTGSGIYRDVWLVTAGQIHIAQWGVFCYTKSVDNRKAVLTVETEIENATGNKVDLTVVQQLLTNDGKEVAKSTKKTNSGNKVLQELTVTNPLLWSTQQPNLYQLKTTLLQNGKTIDETTATIGIRTFTFDPDKGFALNGQWMKMKGVCIHHDAGVLGAAVPREVWKRRLEILKEIGCNAIRMSHNPQATDVYQVCDELGLLVMDEAFDEWEFSKRKWLKGWNIGIPGFEGSYDFFDEWSSRDAADMVRRDRNHVSIFAWSIGNEVDYPNDPYSHPVLDGTTISQPIYGGYQPDQPDAMRLGRVAERLASVVREHDVSRPVTGALAGIVMSNATTYPEALDIVGYNYTEDRYAEDHANYPKRVIYGSENRHDMMAWKSVRDNEFIFGQFLWTGIDFLGEAGAWPSRGSQAGLLDLCGFMKPRAYYRQALWAEKPVAYIGAFPVQEGRRTSGDAAWPVWNFNEGQMIRVVCFTNASKAKLLLNGNEAGQTKNCDDETGWISWDIPFKPGTLEVVGMDASGNKTCGYTIRTSGRPYALTASADHTSIRKEKGLAQVSIQVVDADGIPVILSDDELTCTIEGPAKLLGLEAGNQADMGNYRDPVQRVFRGRLLAYIQATGDQGSVIVKFSAPWLKPASVHLDVQ